jgi:uncharacterized protein (DUF427 family)
MTQVLAPYRPFDTSLGHALIFEESPRRVRTILGGETVADSKRMMLLHESMHLPIYYFPREDVRMELLAPSDTAEEDEHKGPATRWHVKVGDRVAENAAVAYDSTPEGAPDLSGYVAFDWNSMDAWFEEDDEVFKHARDPYHRVDVVSSSRPVRVEVDGVTVAETTRPSLLFETGLPTRFYIPKADVKMECLTPTDTHSVCPYKGTASYWSVTVNGKTFEDVVWGYPTPIPECPKIANLLSFYDEKVDVYLDGELQERPQSPFA